MKTQWTAENYLMHHGIQGQKWGVRRFQNPDGSLTALGKQRYGSSNGNSRDTNDLSKDKKDYDHSKSNKSPLARWAANTAIDALMLNPIGLTLDAVNLGSATMATIKEKINESRMSKLEVDSETGLHKKAKEFTEKEDMAAVNPGFANFDTNSKNNCMLCTTAYELRRRGYDVAANKASYGYEHDLLAHVFKNAKEKFVVPPRVLDPNSTNFKDEKKQYKLDILKAKNGQNKELAEKTISALSEQEVGARGNIMVGWGAGGGHSMVYEVTDKGVIIRDCQSNKVYDKPEKILRYCVRSSYLRTDNLELNKENLKEVVH